MDNLKLWNSVCVTDPARTKVANNGRYKFTCVDPQWQAMKATEQFGAYGAGWGIKDCKFTMLGETAMMLEAKFWYTIDEKVIEFEYAVDMRYREGDDACKKLLTSFQSKCLSKLGFSADVYMGLYDDVQYVRDASIKHSTKSKQAEWVTEVISSIEACKTKADLSKCKSRFEGMVGNSVVPEDYVDAINQAVYDKEKGLKK